MPRPRNTALQKIAQDQEECLDELVGLGMTSQEDADGFWWQNWEKQKRATVRKALEAFVEADQLTRKEAEALLEQTIRVRKEEEMTMRMRMEEAMAMRREESPDGPRQDTPDTEEAHNRPRGLMEQEGVGREKVNTAQESPWGQRILRQENVET